MYKQYYIALYLLGIKNTVLIDIMNILPEKQLINLFRGDIYEVEYKYNLNLVKYSILFENQKLIKEKLESAKVILEKNRILKIKTTIYKEKSYPNRLKSIENPPAIIYTRGKSITKEDLKAVACVGSREISSFGKSSIESIIGNLTREKFTIISGLANGVDKLAHEVCLIEKGRTIAVLAHGLDIIYPKENADLAKRIIENDGTLISEYPVDTKADKFRFIARNRIISALSAGVIMIEAKEKSGTRHTVDFAMKQNKLIFTPLPTMKELCNGLNFELIYKNQAMILKIKNDYSIVVEKLGYKIKYDQKMIETLKNNSLDKVITTLTNSQQQISISTMTQNDSRTGFDVNKEVYSKFKKILKDNDLTIREFFNAVINSIVKTYDGGENNG